MNRNSPKLTLVSMEGEKYQVDMMITDMSGLIRDMIEDNASYDEDIELRNIEGSYLQDIIQYCEHYNFEKQVDIPRPLPSSNLAQELKDQFEVQFIQKYDLDGTIKMIEYSNFLNIPAIFELACASVASLFKGKSFEQVKKDFGLEDEVYTPEEEEALKLRFPWITSEFQNIVKRLEGNPPPINRQ
ncbi:UNKNOWN [Stylonychia lemnae]|uniref:Uncharacterized protein n=1 Tax=Stylonychia lemnae TaxID=5949 RepID=A0A077ZW45_STYLE|nr:UNKNOWN [Stylonychia lemnae]|eukprot:CDW74175.1 UNKNOWN [Stylonychia lemnae]